MSENTAKERGILMSAPMVLATLREVDPKTKTRRAVRGAERWPAFATRATMLETRGTAMAVDAGRLTYGPEIKCPYGKVGDRLWVRETHSIGPAPDLVLEPGEASGALRWPAVTYKADGETKRCDTPWKGRFGKTVSAIHMFRWASRITLEITGVRVERLQEISEADAVAEGIRISSKARRSDACYGIYECLMPDGKTYYNDSAYDLYRTLWEQINGAGSWDLNPWVWVVEFKRIHQTQGATNALRT